MQNNPRKLVGRIIGLGFFVLIILFGFNRFGRYLEGPKIIDINLEQYSEISENPIKIEGRLKNTARLEINGVSTPINDDLSFSKTIVIPHGNSIIEIDIYDTFNKENNYQYWITHSGVSGTYPATLEQANAVLITENENETTALTE